MHISSLPSPYGIGTLGQAAYDFADFLKAAGQHYWQLLPIGPTSYGDSPYQSFSTHAGNPYFIDLDLLREDGLLTQEEIDAVDWEAHSARVDYGFQYSVRFDLLYRAFLRGWERDADAVREFRNANPWVEDYALYMALKRSQDMRSWETWPEEIRLRRPGAAETYAVRLGDDVHFFIYLQYLFFGQWDALRSYVHALGLEIIGDLPIYVPYDSCDVWANPSLFQLDETGLPTGVAGCPPDYFSADGQLWGNPLYDWDYHKTTGYKWWIDRIRRQLTLTDYLRIDHFRGFEAYWSVPAEEETAINGKWVKGPCEDLFHAIEKALGSNLPIFAEDLGIITPEVEHLRDSLGFPGMKVLQFGFGDLNDKNYVPHFYTSPNCICYTGTHDNDTTMGWYAQQPEVIRDRVRRYGNTDGNMVSLDFIRFCMASIAKYAIFPIQDLCLMGSDARMNTPGVAAANWAFRYVKEDLTQGRKNWLLKTTRLFGRCPLGPEDYTV